MRQLIVCAVVLGAGGRAQAGTPTCAEAVDHAIAVSASDPRMQKMSAQQLADFRKEGLDDCASKPWSDTQRACYGAATDIDGVLACEDAADAAPATQATLPVELPARSADGKTLALPTRSEDIGEHHTYVELVALGKSDGDVLDLESRYPDTAGDPDTGEFGPDTVEDHTDAVAPQLAGYVALPHGTGTVDGVTMTVTSGKKLKVVLKVGKKVVGKTTIADGVASDVEGFAVVRGKTSWVYLDVDHERDESASTHWVAVKVKLPPRADVAMPALTHAITIPAELDASVGKALAARDECTQAGPTLAAAGADGKTWVAADCSGGGLVGFALFAGSSLDLVGADASGGDFGAVQALDVYDAGFPLACVTWTRQNGDKEYARLDCFAPGAIDPVFSGDAMGESYRFVVGATPAIIEKRGKKSTRHAWDGKRFP